MLYYSALTIFDRGITMETGWDFSLQAHKCLQATAKPAHYIVLRNEFDKGNDALDGDALEQVVCTEKGKTFGL